MAWLEKPSWEACSVLFALYSICVYKLWAVSSVATVSVAHGSKTPTHSTEHA